MQFRVFFKVLRFLGFFFHNETAIKPVPIHNAIWWITFREFHYKCSSKCYCRDWSVFEITNRYMANQSCTSKWLQFSVYQRAVPLIPQSFCLFINISQGYFIINIKQNASTLEKNSTSGIWQAWRVSNHRFQ